MANQEWDMWPATNGFNIHQGCETIAEHVPREDIARKMIAAPELLKACKALVSPTTFGQEGHVDFIEAVKLANAAIAKAEGK